MGRFNGGWIKLWRRAVEGDLADNMFLWGLWNWLLYAATWKPTSIIWNGKRRDIPPGTVVMGMSELAEKWDCSTNTIKKWLNYLVESERIYLEVCTRGTLVTVRNWDVYQAEYAEDCKPSENEVHTDCKPSENQVQLNEEGKKERRKEETSNLGSQIETCCQTWKETLSHRGLSRELYAFEKAKVGRFIQQFGVEAATHALYGFRFEEPFDGFNPKGHLTLDRVFDREKIEKWINLGAMNAPKRRELVEVKISC